MKDKLSLQLQAKFILFFFLKYTIKGIRNYICQFRELKHIFGLCSTCFIGYVYAGNTISEWITEISGL